MKDESNLECIYFTPLYAPLRMQIYEETTSYILNCMFFSKNKKCEIAAPWKRELCHVRRKKKNHRKALYWRIRDVVAPKYKSFTAGQNCVIIMHRLNASQIHGGKVNIKADTLIPPPTNIFIPLQKKNMKMQNST